MYLHEILHGEPPVESTDASRLDPDELHRLAVRRVERKRKFHERAIGAAVLAVIVTVIWAISEYHNAGGWPSSLTSFSQSSGIPGVWNIWIIYPLLALGLGAALDACFTYLRRPMTESDIRREMERLR